MFGKLSCSVFEINFRHDVFMSEDVSSDFSVPCMVHEGVKEAINVTVQTVK